MSKASELVLDLVTKPLSPKQIKERQEAEQPRTDLIATLDGEWVEPAPTPTQAPRPILKAPPQTID